MTTTFRMMALATCAALPLMGCVNQAAMDPNLTPAQRTMREAAQNWNVTVATGTGAGALLGAGAGALLGGRQGAVFGGIAGAAVGTAAGVAVANRNWDFARQEAPLQDRIANATAESNRLGENASLARQVAAENTAHLAQLDAQYRRGQISAAQYAQSARTARQDLNLIKSTRRTGEDLNNRLQETAAITPQLAQGGLVQRNASNIQTLGRAEQDLERALSRVPAV